MNLDILPSYKIKQGYLSKNKEKTVRVRITEDEAFLTIKGKTIGSKRLEFEYPIPKEDVEVMFSLCGKDTLDKTRYLLKKGMHTWEIDVFHGLNEGLIVAEIELESEDENFDKPNWIKEDVTEDIKYLNSKLLDKPYSKW